MSKISENKKTSGVKILCNFLILLGLFLPHVSSAAITQADIDKQREKCEKLSAAASVTGAERAAGDAASSCETRLTAMEAALAALKKSDGDLCKSAKEALRKAKSEQAKKCGEAGLGDECQQQANDCASASQSEAHDTMGALSTAAGYPQLSGIFQTLNMGDNNKDNANGVCAKYNGKDYATEKKRITEELKKTAKELVDLKKEIAKSKKEFAKEIQDIQKEVQDAQKELDKQKLKIKDSKRQRLADFMNTQNQQKEQMRQKNMSILDIKGKIVSSERDKAMKLVALTEASGKRTCMNEYNKARANYQKTNSSSTANFMASSSAKKSDLVAIYTDCMAVFNQQRTALNESKKQEMETLNAQLANLQSEVDDLNGNIQLSANQLAEMEQDAATEGSQAELEVIKLMQTAQQKMLTAQEEQNSNQQAFAQEQQNLTNEQNRLNNDLMKMGPVPDDANKSTPKSISKEVGVMAEEILSLEEDVKTNCGSEAKRSSTSRSGSTRSGKK